MPTGALWQLQGVLKWLHLCHSPDKVLTPYHELVARLIAKGHTHCCELLGHEPSNIAVPFSKDQQHWLWQFSDLQHSALANFMGQVEKLFPYSKLLQFASLHVFVFLKIIASSPLSKAVTNLTDASEHGTAAHYTKDCYKFEYTVFASTQRAELYAVVIVFRNFPQQPINLYNDSHYVVGVLLCIETAYIGHTNN
jgi:hypothetical protein